MRTSTAQILGIATALLFSLSCCGLVDADTDTDGGEEVSVARAINSAKTASELNKAYALLLRDPELLGKLQTSPSTGLALQAAWEELKQSMPPSPASPVRSGRFGTRRINRIALARFIGFVEGRLRVAVPGWWEDRLAVARGNIFENSSVLYLHIRANGLGNYYSMPVFAGKRELDNMECMACGNVTKVEATAKRLTIHLPTCGFQVTRPTGNTIYVAIEKCDSSTSFVLVHDTMPKGTLLKVNTASGKVIWKQSLWCDMAPFIRGGDGGFHWSEVQAQCNTAIVFGLRNDVVYIEGFNKSTGTPLFRFSSTYGWYPVNEERPSNRKVKDREASPGKKKH